MGKPLNQVGGALLYFLAQGLNTGIIVIHQLPTPRNRYKHYF